MPQRSETGADVEDTDDQKNEPSVSSLQYVLLVLCSGIILFFAIGLANSSGMFYVTLIEEFQLTSSAISVIGGLNCGLPFVLSPLVSLLLEKFPTRAMLSVGGIIYASGYAFAFLTRSFWPLVVCLGIMPGVGGAGVVLMTTNLIGQYFDERRGLAISLALVGAGLGTMVLPHVVQVLIDAYTWRGACLIIGAIHFNVVPSALCLKEPRKYELKRKRNNEVRTGDDTEDSAEHTFLSPPDTAPNLLHSSHLSLAAEAILISTCSLQNLGRTKSIEHHKSNDDMTSNISVEIAAMKQRSTHSIDTTFSHKNESTKQKLISVLRSNRVKIFTSQNMLFFCGVQAVFLYLPAYALQLGVAKNKITWLLTTIGLFGLIGNPVWGRMGDIQLIKRHITIFYCIGTFTCALTCLLLPLFTSLGLLLLFTTVFGFALSANFVLVAPLVIEYVGLRHLSISLGLVLMAQGVGQVLSPPLVGTVFDATGSYGLALLSGGGLMLLSVLLVATIEILHRGRCITA